MADLSTNFILKNADVISIENQDVQRIRMLNDIVWEKHKPTVTTLSISPTSTTYGSSYTLTATTKLSQNNTVIDGVIDIYDVTNGANTKIKSVTTTNGVAKHTISNASAGTHKYKAIFQQKGVYDSSTSSIQSCTINKKTPSFNEVGTATIYKGWEIGVKLTSNKTALANKKVSITINGSTYNKTTDSKGIARLTVNLSPGTYTVTYKYAGDNEYNSITTTRKYTLKDYQTKNLSISSESLGSQSGSSQKWEKNSSGYQCYKNNLAKVNTGNGIATANGTRKNPSPLTLTFNKGTISKINKVSLSFVADQKPAVKNNAGGGLFAAPSVTLNINGSNETAKTGKAFTKYKYYQNYYASKGPVTTSLSWSYSNGKSLSSLKVTIDYPASTGTEEGFITLSKITLTVSYIPTQTAF